MKNYTLIPALLTALALAVGITPAAQADTPPVQASVTAEAIVNASAKEVRGVDFTLSPAPPAGTQIHVSAFSCGNFLQEATYTNDGGPYDNRAFVWFSPDGTPGVVGNPIARKVGKSVEYQIDIVQPGYDAYHLTGSLSDYGTVDGKPVSASRPSCDEINGTVTGGGDMCKVTKQAKKSGKARVGRTVRVRSPHTNGHCGRIGVVWKANGKVVKQGKKFHLARKLRDRKLVAVVKLSHGPKKVLRFGRIR